MTNHDGSLQLRLQAASTPERVGAAAALFGRIVRTAFPDLDPGSITMVVHNLDMRAGLRPQDRAGKRAVDGLIRFAANPDDEARKHPDTASAIAAAFAHHADAWKEYPASLCTPRRSLAALDESFASKMRKIRDQVPSASMRGGATIYSVVYKVGRASDKSKYEKARVDLDGIQQEIRIDGPSGPYFDAAKSRQTMAIRVEAVWRRDGRRYVFDASRTRAKDIRHIVSERGADILAIAEGMPDSFDEMLDRMIDEFERDAH